MNNKSFKEEIEKLKNNYKDYINDETEYDVYQDNEQFIAELKRNKIFKSVPLKLTIGMRLKLFWKKIMYILTSK